MSHIAFLVGVLGFALVCVLVLSERWQGQTAQRIRLASALAGLSAVAHGVAGLLDGGRFSLAWLFAILGVGLALGWAALARHIDPKSEPKSEAKAMGLERRLAQRSAATASTAIAFAGGLAAYIGGFVSH